MPEEPSIFSGKLSDQDLESFFWECYDASRERFGGSGERSIKKRWSRNFAAYGSDFLSKAERDYLISTDRPPVEINLLTAKINAVRGSVGSSKMEVQFKPHTTSDTASVKSGWLTLLVRKAMVDCGGYDHQDGALHDDLCTGYGAAEIYLDTSRVPFRGILRQVELHELWPDPDATEMLLANRTFDIRVRKWLVEQVIGRWEEKEDEIKKHAERYGTFGVGQQGRQTGKRGGATQSGGHGKDSLRGRVEVGELIYQRWMKRVRWYDPERKVRRDTLPDELEKRKKELEKILDANGLPLYEAVEEEQYRGETWYRAHVLLGGFDTTKRAKGARGLLILDHEESPRVGSTIQWLTGLTKKDPEKEKTEFFNVLDIAYGLQMVLNRTLQEELAILGREAKGGAYYTEEAVPEDYPGGEAQWLKDQSKPGANTKIASEGWEFFRAKDLPRIPPGLDRMEEKLVQWIAQAMAITDAFVGSVQQERSAVYLSNLQQQGLVTLGPVLGPYVAFIKQCGVAMAEVLIRHLPVADIDRLLDHPEYEGLTHELDPESGELMPIMVDDPDAPVIDPETGVQAYDPETQEPMYEQVPLSAGMVLKQENPLDYEVNVDTGQATISLRYAIWEMVEQGILQTMQNALPPAAFRKFLLFMVKNIPITGEQGATLSKEIEAAIEQDDQLQTLEGVKAYLLAQGPDVAMPALQEVAEQLQAQIPPGDGGTPAGPPEEMPPEEMSMDGEMPVE